MVKVITYGTYDLLHYGHIRLLERAKALGDYLIVGVTADDFDMTRGKINVQQSLMERVEAVRATGIADEVIIEEYEGQKIHDIQHYGVDIFTVGSDWEGTFDYLREYCKVVYLDRTQGISSTDLRTSQRTLRVGFVGQGRLLAKYIAESKYVNGLSISGIYCGEGNMASSLDTESIVVADTYNALLDLSDAVYIQSHPALHYEQCKQALLQSKHVLCESPVALSAAQYRELQHLAQQNQCVLMAGVKTAFATAYNRLVLLLKSGKIGQIVSVDATCTSLQPMVHPQNDGNWNSICMWGPTAMLPIFQILGTSFQKKDIVTWLADSQQQYDLFTKIDFYYPNAVASLKVGNGVKSEGQLVITGTQGYVLVPAPWWKTDYFEVRYEDQNQNKRYFYQLDGEGIRHEFVAFCKAVETGTQSHSISDDVAYTICSIIEDFYTQDKNTILLR